ncbi:MAG: 2-C-methyl-D-erythritol 4-phosphate cytidylyltransferase [Bacillota bacterium]|nr:2-C-methyl-D-erythritol 4-phosphate cytidylyltransferase [Bacillota bacterium]
MYKEFKVIVVVPAAGSGKRMNSDKNKLLVKIGKDTIVEKTLDVFEKNKYIDEMIVVTNDSEIINIVRKFSKVRNTISGGVTRQESVYKGISSIEEDGIVLIHDAARPFITDEIIERVIEMTHLYKACIPAVKIKDTIKTIDGKFISKTLDRDSLISVQTPQGFRLNILKEAYELKNSYPATDDASLVEKLGYPVLVVRGDYNNIKLTTTEDIKHARSIGGVNDVRIGIGFDVHKLVENRDLILGGVKIPYEKGLLGHSDADVLVHAIMDAVLGSIGKGDIGRIFPDTDNDFKNISSLLLLKEVGVILDKEGYKINNIDAVVIAQKPKISPFIEEMKKNIAMTLNADISQINIKGTTTERLGFEGRGEGISSQAVVIVDNK